VASVEAHRFGAEHVDGGNDLDVEREPHPFMLTC
jgi:hypothetical protein